MPLRYDPISGKLNDVSDSTVDQERILKAVPGDVLANKDQMAIPMIDDDGNAIFVGKHDVKDAVDNGFRYEAPEESDQRVEAKKYDSPLAAAALGSARAATFGLSDAAAWGSDKLFGTNIAEHFKKLQQYNPKATLAADVITNLGLAVATLGASELGAAGRLITAPTRLVTEIGSEVGSRAATKFLGEQVASRTLGSSVGRAIVEKGLEGVTLGALYGGGSALTEQSLGTKDGVGESIMRHVGFGALFGGTLGATVGGLSEVGKAATSKWWDVLRKNYGADEAELKNIIHAPDPEAALATDPILQKNLAQSAALKAAEEEGVFLSAGSKTGSEIAKGSADALSQSPTIFSLPFKAGKEKEYSDLITLSKAILSDQGEKTTAELGTTLIDKLQKNFESKYEGLSSRYGKQSEVLKMLPVGPNQITSLKNAIQSKTTGHVFNPNNSYLVSRVENAVESLVPGKSTFEDLEKVRRQIRDYAGKAYRFDPADGAVIGGLQDRTQQVIRRGVVSHLETATEDPALASQVAKEFMSEQRTLGKDYSGFLTEMKGFFSQSGVKKNFKARGQNFSEFLDSFRDNPEKFANYFIKNENPEFWNSFSKAFPDMADQLRKLRITLIAEKSNVGGVFEPNKFFKQIREMSERELDVFGPEGAKKADNLKKILAVQPKKIGPSGTPQGLAYMGGGLANIKQNITDGLTIASHYIADKSWKILNKVEGAETKEIYDSIVGLRLARVAAADKTEKAVKFVPDFLKLGTVAAGESINKALNNKIDNISDKINYLAQNPDKIVSPEVYGKISGMDSDVASSVQARAIAAMNILKANLPTKTPSGMLDENPASYDVKEVSDFYKVANLIENPKSILSDIENGTVTQKQVEIVKTLFPNYFAKIVGVIGNVKKSNQTFGNKIGINKFIGNQGLTSAKPSVISGIQSAIDESTMEDAQAKRSVSTSQNLKQQSGPTRTEELTER